MDRKETAVVNERTSVQPPEPAYTEQQVAWSLAADLLGRPADEQVMAALQAAVEVHPHKSGALVRRLRAIRTRGWQTKGKLDVLCRQITFLY
jgi:hypothetical protein